jgi:polyferredoxin
MSVETLCQICETAPAEHRCSRCGALVCPTHYDEKRGLCTECATVAEEGPL